MQQKRSNNRLRLMVAGWLLLAGCEPSIETELNEKIGGGPNFAASDAVPSADPSGDSEQTAEEAEEDSPDDAPSEMLMLNWSDGPQQVSVSDDALHLTLKNISKRSLEVEVAFLFMGLVFHERTLVQKRRLLDAGEEETFALPAASIPLQSAAAACQAHVTATAFEPGTDKQVGYMTAASPLFYRFDETYETMQLYDVTALVNERQGKLLSLSAADAAAAKTSPTIIGRAADESGRMVEIPASSLYQDNAGAGSAIVEVSIDFTDEEEVKELEEVSHAQ